MPAKGLSLHIGLNFVDPSHYDGWDGALAACEFDANDMNAVAVKRGFTSRKLLTAAATASAVIGAIKDAAMTLASGDLFLLTYSGHGGQVPDGNNDETDSERQDETWVLYDRQLVDDELWALWTRFKAGVRIFVLSDSCHSGTVVRAMPTMGGASPGAGKKRRIRLLPPAQAAKVYRANRATYDSIQKAHPAAEKAAVKAAILLISGCQDNQYSLDGERNGLFTETLRKVWANGKYKGDYRSFRNKIAARMPDTQSPNYYVVGKPNPAFEAQRPFTI
ncbi:MAG: caspase family protein [Verrucomicrobia bacterium]|nr:caspase family protein [Verrucomicrobiota bacterium]